MGLSSRIIKRRSIGKQLLCLLVFALTQSGCFTSDLTRASEKRGESIFQDEYYQPTQARKVMAVPEKNCLFVAYQLSFDNDKAKAVALEDWKLSKEGVLRFEFDSEESYQGALKTFDRLNSTVQFSVRFNPESSEPVASFGSRERFFPLKSFRVLKSNSLPKGRSLKNSYTETFSGKSYDSVLLVVFSDPRQITWTRPNAWYTVFVPFTAILDIATSPFQLVILAITPPPITPAR